MKSYLSILFSVFTIACFSQAKTDTQLTDQANAIRNETQAKGITKAIVADMFQALTDSKVNVSQYAYVIASGTNAYAAAIDPPISTYADLKVFVKFPATNTGSPTLNFNSLGPISIRRNGSILAPNAIPAGRILQLIYDGTYFQIVDGLEELPSQTTNANKLLTTDGTAPSWSLNFLYDGTNRRLNIGSGNANYQGTDNFVIGLGSSISTGNQGFVISESSTIERTSGSKGVSDNAIYGGYNSKITTTSAHAQTGSFSNFIGSGINNQILDGTTSFIGAGRYNIVSNESAGAMGEDAHATGYASFAHGYVERGTIPAPPSAASLYPVLATGTGSLNWSANSSLQTSGHGALATRSTILNSKDANIPVDAIGSAIIGGYNIKATSDSSMVYVPNLNVNYVPINDDTINQVLVREYATGRIKYRNALSFLPSSIDWSIITGTPTTISGYGIPSIDWSAIVNTPTTISGYGITDGVTTAGVGLTKAGATISLGGTISSNATISMSASRTLNLGGIRVAANGSSVKSVSTYSGSTSDFATIDIGTGSQTGAGTTFNMANSFMSLTFGTASGINCGLSANNNNTISPSLNIAVDATAVPTVLNTASVGRYVFQKLISGNAAGITTGSGMSFLYQISKTNGSLLSAQEDLLEYSSSTLNSETMNFTKKLSKTGSLSNAYVIKGSNMEFDIFGSFVISTVGSGIQIKEGANATSGISSALSSGATTVSTTKVTANSRIYLQRQTDGGTVSASYSITRTAGTSFTITGKDGSGATNTADTSTIAWIIIEPAP